MSETELARAGGTLLARCLVGLLFFQGALWRVFTMGPLEHARRFFVEPYAGSYLPEWSLWMAGVAVPFVELIGGGLLLLGFLRIPALFALGGVLTLVTFGHLVAEPLFSIADHVFPRSALILFLLAVPAEWDRFSADQWRRRRTRP